jgi:DNA-binding transcriptional regulator YiaG
MSRLKEHSTKAIASKRKYGSVVAEDLIHGMQSLIDDMQSGKGITVREVSIELSIPDLIPEEVRAIRDSLGLSQTLFAEFLGASASAVRSWERGAKIPTPMARRFLDSIRVDPEYWLAKVQASMTTKQKKARAKSSRQTTV